MNSQDKEDKAPQIEVSDIEAGLEKVRAKSSDEIDNLEATSAENTRLELQNDHLREKIASLAAAKKLREELAKNVFKFLLVYSVVVLILIFFEGFNLFGFDMPDLTLTALAGGTAVAILGIIGYIAKGLGDNLK